MIEVMMSSDDDAEMWFWDGCKILQINGGASKLCVVVLVATIDLYNI